jgi:hydroxyacylglutathione hydrolase
MPDCLVRLKASSLLAKHSPRSIDEADVATPAIRALTCLGVSAVGIAAALRERRLLASWAITGVLSRRPLIGPVRLADGVEWWDDWFTVEYIDDRTIAIGEPRYYQLNHSYLVLGDDRAILFDSGPGVRPIGAVVADLTDLAVTVVASHLHFDHVGGHVDFDSIGLVTFPGLVEIGEEGTFQPSYQQHLGLLEKGSTRPIFRPDHTWNAGDKIELGRRTIEIIHTPGHSEDSICLLDRAANLLLSGDTLYDGDLLAATAGSDLDQYLESASMLIDLIEDDTCVLGAHTIGERPRAPRLTRADLIDLEGALVGIDRSTPSGFARPKRHPVNDRVSLFVG